MFLIIVLIAGIIFVSLLLLFYGFSIGVSLTLGISISFAITFEIYLYLDDKDKRKKLNKLKKCVIAFKDREKVRRKNLRIRKKRLKREEEISP